MKKHPLRKVRRPDGRAEAPGQGNRFPEVKTIIAMNAA
jgi:hypothetical protein